MFGTQKNVVLSLLFGVALCVFMGQFFAQPVQAAPGINRQVNFQGKVTNPDGTNVVNGSYSFTFSIYSVSSGGSAIWTETKNLTVTDGIFQTQLGDTTSLPGSVNFNDDSIYLGINFNSDGEMTPRVRFTAAPYAFNSEQLGGINASGFIQNTVTTQVANFNVQSANAGNVTAVIQGAASQTADIMQIQNSAGAILVAIDKDGKLVFGPSGAQDTNLYRSGANALATDDTLRVGVSGTGSTRLEVAGNNQSLPTLGSGLTVQWNYSSGQGEVDLFSGRGAGSTGGFSFYDWNGSTATQIARLIGTGTNQGQLQLPIQGANAGILIGGDTNLYRSSANVLATDDAFTITNAGGATTLQLTSTASNTGITLGGDTNLYRSAANTLRTDDSFIVPGLSSISISGLTNTSYNMSNSGAGSYPAYSPVPKYLWHDLLAFNRWWGAPTFETYNGTWNSGTVDNNLFSQKEAYSTTVVNGTTNTAARWTWNSGNAAYAYPSWWALGFSYNGATASSKNILIESSADGVTWNTRHTSTGNTANAVPVWAYMSDNAAETYIRLTITVTNSQPLTMASIKALSSRWGNQGGGSEYEFPYSWDASQNIAVGAGATVANSVLTVGTNTTTSSGGITFGNDTNLYRAGTSMLKTDDSFLIQTASNSTTAFQIQNSSAQTLFVADTSNQRVAVGPAAVAANGVLTVGTNTTAATGGIYFGTDTNLYRSAADTLRTDDTLSVGGGISAVSDITANNLRNYYLTRTMPTVTNDYVEIGYTTMGSGGQNIDLAVTVSDSGFSAAKRYSFTSAYCGTICTTGTWYRVQPDSSTGAYGSNDFEVDVMQDNATSRLYYRIRRTGGSTAGTARVSLQQRGDTSISFTSTSATGSTSAPSAYWQTAVLTQAFGAVGLNTTPTSGGGLLQLADGTTAAEGIKFGADVNLYRSATNTLKTDDNMEVAGTFYSQGSATIGTGSTSTNLAIRGNSYNGTTVDIYSDTASGYSFFRRARGTYASPTATTSGSYLGSFGFRGYDGSAFFVQDGARFSALATENHSAGVQGTALAFYTASNGTLTAAERMRIDQSGYVGFGTASNINSRITLAAATNAAGGILFGTDTNLYRSAADVLTTDDSLTVGGNLIVTGTTATKAVNASGYATTSTGASDAGKWTKLGTCTITVQYQDCGTALVITNNQDGSSTTQHATLYWRVKQQNALGGVPGIELEATDLRTLVKDQFKTVTTTNDGSSTVVELWGRIDASYQVWKMTPIANSGIVSISWHENQGFSVSLPAGTQTSAVHSDTWLNTLSVQPSVNTTTAMRVRDASGNTSLVVDTTNQRVAVNQSSAAYTLDVNGDINATGVLRVSGSQISSSNLSDNSNIAKLNGTGPQVFSGNNRFNGTFLSQASSDSTAAFQIQNAAGTSNLFVADTTNTRLGIGKTSPGYTVDVNGDINISGTFRVNGVTICTSGGCVGTGGSGSYIDNDYASQQSANFNIISTATNRIGGIIAGTSGQTADIFQLKDGSGTNIFSAGATGNTIIRAADSFQVQNSGGTALLYTDTANSIIKIGTTSAATQVGSELLVTDAEFSGSVRFGDDTNRIEIDGTTKKLLFVGSARQNRRVTFEPEYPGAVLTGDGSNNTGTMTTDFCSGSSRLSINTGVCGSTDEFNYYSWIGSGGTNDYDVYVRWQVPSDFSAFKDANAINLRGWRSTSTEKVELAMFQQNGTQCGSTTEVNSSNTTWQTTNMTGDETGCSVSADDVITFRVRLTAGSGGYARGGGLEINYLSKF